MRSGFKNAIALNLNQLEIFGSTSDLVQGTNDNPALCAGSVVKRNPPTTPTNNI